MLSSLNRVCDKVGFLFGCLPCAHFFCDLVEREDKSEDPRLNGSPDVDSNERFLDPGAPVGGEWKH